MPEVEKGYFARVVMVEAAEGIAWIDLMDGSRASITGTVEGFSEGEVLFVSEGDYGPTVKKVDPTLWRDEEAIGRVRAKFESRSIIDLDGRDRLVPNSPVDYQPGDTVVFRVSTGVVSVLPEPLEPLPPRYGEPTPSVAKFRKSPGSLTFDDFGGYERVRNRISEVIGSTFESAELLKAIHSKPVKGVLFTGPPGTGKTFMARIIASVYKATFYTVSGAEVSSKWYGESEQLLRNLFRDAEKESPSIIFFDEIDSLAGRRDHDTSEVSKRVVAELLVSLDGFDLDSGVIVIAATNRAHDLDPALLRPGRFDWRIDFPLPEPTDRMQILSTGLRAMNAEPDIPVEAFIDLTMGWSGAELGAIWTEAAILAATDGRDRILLQDVVGGYERSSEARKEGA